jgi:hypothetical protein
MNRRLLLLALGLAVALLFLIVPRPGESERCSWVPTSGSWAYSAVCSVVACSPEKPFPLTGWFRESGRCTWVPIPGNLTYHPMICSTGICPPEDSCCSMCHSNGASFQPPEGHWPGRSVHVPLGCIDHGCGRSSCAVPEGRWTLPAGSWIQPSKSFGFKAASP